MKKLKHFHFLNIWKMSINVINEKNGILNILTKTMSLSNSQIWLQYASGCIFAIFE